MFDQRQEDESLELAIKLWQNPFLGCVLSAPAEIPFFQDAFSFSGSNMSVVSRLRVAFLDLQMKDLSPDL